MQIDDQTIEKVLQILHEEIVPAQGCTEPIAVAFVAAKARELLGETPFEVRVYASGNIIKNVKSVVVPNSGGMTGIKTAAAMGIVAGRVDRDLMVISHVTPSDMKRVHAFLEQCPVEVIHEKTNIRLYLRIELTGSADTVSVEIKHLHTNITRIAKNGKVLVNRPCSDTDFNSALTDREILSVELICQLAKEIELTRIAPLFNEIIRLNTAIAEEGIKETHGINIGSCILKNIEQHIYGDDLRNRCAAFTAAGSDARMSGCALPVMTTSGSGNQGMTASLPIIQYCRVSGISEEQLIRALFLSHLATIHIKTRVGRLSAYCGAICAAAGVSGALAFLLGGDSQTVGSSIINTLGNISGVICDGAKASCAMKIATGIYAAFDSATLACHHRVLHGGDGIVGSDVEETIRNIGKLARIGMHETDDVILGIMTNDP